jgi:hypothetical protein
MKTRSIRSSIAVRAPDAFTIAFLHAYLREDGNDANLPLEVPLRRLAAGIVLERNVEVRLSYVPRTPEAAARLNIAWVVPGTDLLPSFRGTLESEAAGPRACILTIRGEYEIPLGWPGAIFDAVAGVRIARATLQALLQRLRDAAEADYLERTFV